MIKNIDLQDRYLIFASYDLLKLLGRESGKKNCL